MKRCFIFIILILTIFLFSLYNTNALLLQPPDIKIDYTPNLQKTFSYSIKSDTVVKVGMYVKGDLNQSIRLHTTEADLKPGEWTGFSFEINLPETLNPGLHDNRIVIVEQVTQGEAIGGRVGVELLLPIRVPYPGRYIEIGLDAEDIKINEKEIFKLKFMNYGKENLTDLEALINIYNSNNELIGSIKSNRVSINPGETKNLNVIWDSKGNREGVYYAKAIVNYDNTKAEASTDFRIGDLLIEIISINGTEIKKGNIGKINIKLTSKWNEKIEDVYAQLQFNTNKGLVSVKSENFDINPWQTLEVFIYLDTKDIDADDYKSELKVFYAGKTIEKNFTLQIKRAIIKDFFSVKNILVIIIIILLLFILFNLNRFKKKKVKR